MTGPEALCLVDTLLQTANQGQRLNDLQSVVFLETWAGSSYRKIAKQLGYEHDYIKQVGSHLWRSISLKVGEKVSKRNIQSILSRYQQSQSTSSAASQKMRMPVQPLDLTAFQNGDEAFDIKQLLSILLDAEVMEEILPKAALRELLMALESLKERALI